MNKEEFYHLIGTYLNGYKIVKVEDDPFIKGQINLWTDEVKSDYFGDINIVKFFIRTDSNSSKIYQELIDKEIFKLKDNWNKLKEYIRKNIIYDEVGMKILDPSPLEDYIQELEKGSDSNE